MGGKGVGRKAMGSKGRGGSVKIITSYSRH